jgi:hypothetical protein
MPAPGFTKIIHPGNGNVATVPRSSLGYHYAAGWAPLDETPESAPEPVPEPAPVRASAVQAALAGQPADQADDDGSSDNQESE